MLNVPSTNLKNATAIKWISQDIQKLNEKYSSFKIEYQKVLGLVEQGELNELFVNKIDNAHYTKDLGQFTYLKELGEDMIFQSYE